MHLPGILNLGLLALSILHSKRLGTHWKQACFMLPGITLLGLVWSLREREVAFDDLEHARTAIAAVGYHCTPTNAHGTTAFGFVVSREPQAWHQVHALPKSKPMGPEWSGKVWVTFVHNRLASLCTIPDDSSARSWGKVVAIGDPRFLDEIEGFFQ